MFYEAQCQEALVEKNDLKEENDNSSKGELLIFLSSIVNGQCHLVVLRQGKSYIFSLLFVSFFVLLNICVFIYLAALGLSCSMRTLSCSMWDLIP